MPLPVKPEGRRAARRDEIRRLLLDVAEGLLDQGAAFGEIPVERLVSAAGLSRSTFYVYFEDKSDLLVAWFGEITHDLESAARQWWELGPDSTRDDLRVALAAIVKTYRPHTTLMAALYDEAPSDAGLRQLVTGMMDANVAGLRKHIRAGQRAGFVDPTLLPAETAGWLTWMAERGLHRLVRGASDAEAERLVESYTSIVWNTLYRPAPSE